MEQWLPAYGFEQTHEVSSEGRVRSRNKVLAPSLDAKGYPIVGLYAVGKRYAKRVHRLVAMAFIPGDHSLQVNHKDGVKTHNTPDNLEWATHLENIRHACNTGLYPTALTDAERDALFADYLVGGYTQRALADKYSLCHQTIAKQLKALRPSRIKRAATHGTTNMHNYHGCRCVLCKEACAESAKQYRRSKKCKQ